MYKKIGVIFITIVGLFGNIWVSGPDIMEIRNFVAAREMVVDGHWVIPMMNGAYRFEKPPLPTWITAIWMKIVGVGAPEWLLRIPAALMGILFIYLLYKMVLLLTKKENLALLASFIAATTIMFTNLANENMWDIYTSVFAFTASYLTLKGMRDKNILNYIGASFMLGASLLSKGPVGIYAMYIPFLIAYSCSYGLKEIKNSWIKILFSIIFGMLIAGLWPLAMYLKDSHIFVKDIFEGTINKEVNTWSNRKQESFFYYFDYPLYAGIWMLPLVFGFFKNWSQNRTKENKFLNMALIWNLLIFLSLSLVGMKKKRYTLPLFMISPMILSVICNYYLTCAKNSLKKSDRILLGFQRGLLVLLCIFVPAIFFAFAYPKGTVGLWYPLICSIIFIPLLWIPFKGNTKAVIIGGGIIMLLGNLTSNWYIDRHLRGIFKEGKAIKYDHERITIFRNNPLSQELYAFNPQMREVWNMGKKINDLALPKYKDNFPLDFLIVSSDEANTIIPKLPGYTVTKDQTFYREENRNNPIYFYHAVKNSI